jgi:DNA polymerase
MNLPKAKTSVPPAGRLDAPIVLVGEQPGRIEVRERRVFVGPAGNELNADLNAANIGRSSCYITNVLKDLDRHKDAYIQLYKGTRLLRDPIISPMGQAHLDFLRWELEQTTARYFGAIGAVALFALTGRTGITKWRGSLLDCTLVEGRKVIPMLHPATVIAPTFQYLNKRLIIFDLKRLKQYQSDLIVPTDRETVVAPTFSATMDFLDYCQQKGLALSTIMLCVYRLLIVLEIGFSSGRKRRSGKRLQRSSKIHAFASVGKTLSLTATFSSASMESMSLIWMIR